MDQLPCRKQQANICFRLLKIETVNNQAQIQKLNISPSKKIMRTIMRALAPWITKALQLAHACWRFDDANEVNHESLFITIYVQYTNTEQSLDMFSHRLDIFSGMISLP